MGDALAALRRKVGLTKQDFTIFDDVRAKNPAVPLGFE